MHWLSNLEPWISSLWSLALCKEAVARFGKQAQKGQSSCPFWRWDRVGLGGGSPKGPGLTSLMMATRGSSPLPPSDHTSPVSTPREEALWWNPNRKTWAGGPQREAHLVWQAKWSKVLGSTWPDLFSLLLGPLLSPPCVRIFLALQVGFQLLKP